MVILNAQDQEDRKEMLTKTDIENFQAMFQSKYEERGEFLDEQRQILSCHRIQLLSHLSEEKEHETKIRFELEHSSNGKSEILMKQLEKVTFNQDQLHYELNKIENQITHIDLELEHGLNWTGL